MCEKLSEVSTVKSEVTTTKVEATSRIHCHQGGLMAYNSSGLRAEALPNFSDSNFNIVSIVMMQTLTLVT